MPLSEAKPDSLARVYAQSAFDLVSPKGRQAIEEFVGELSDIRDLADKDARFAEFLASPAVPVASRERSLRKMLTGRVSDLTLRFLLTLNAKRRLYHLPAVVQVLDELAQTHFGRVEVDVHTAAPMTPEEVGKTRDRLQQILAREVLLHPYVDHAMIGGIRFRIGDRLIDASYATQLRRVRESLAERGAAQLRTRLGSIITD